MSRIKTTVVGSYPVPDWLVSSPSEQALIDATRVVIHTQEQAGVDVVCDGELYRFDINHPETNGMIEYFVRPMDGVTQRFSFDDLIAYRSKSGMKFRTRPPGTVVGPDRPRQPRPAAGLQPRQGAGLAHLQVHAHRAAHAGQDADRQALRRHRRAGACDRRCAGRAGEASRRRHRADRRGQSAGPSRGVEVGGLRNEPRARCGARHGGGAPVLRQLRRPDHPEGHAGTG